MKNNIPENLQELRMKLYRLQNEFDGTYQLATEALGILDNICDDIQEVSKDVKKMAKEMKEILFPS